MIDCPFYITQNIHIPNKNKDHTKQKNYFLRFKIFELKTISKEHDNIEGNLSKVSLKDIGLMVKGLKPPVSITFINIIIVAIINITIFDFILFINIINYIVFLYYKSITKTRQLGKTSSGLVLKIPYKVEPEPDMAA